MLQDVLWFSLHKFVEPLFMNWPGKKLREKALRAAMEHIHYEDENTRYICIGPVNKVSIYCMLFLHFFLMYLCFSENWVLHIEPETIAEDYNQITNNLPKNHNSDEFNC